MTKKKPVTVALPAGPDGNPADLEEIKQVAVEAPAIVVASAPVSTEESDRQAKGEREEEALTTEGERSERALTTEGQRRVNLIWEYTQSYIAVIVVTATIVAAMYETYTNPEDFPDILTLLAGVVVGNYFARTNHTAIGGIGPKPQEQTYTGR